MDAELRSSRVVGNPYIGSITAVEASVPRGVDGRSKRIDAAVVLKRPRKEAPELGGISNPTGARKRAIPWPYLAASCVFIVKEKLLVKSESFGLPPASQSRTYRA
ncbi:hypothetical protein TIFTF001_021080 [Ficus carica]|uniref:Uncharacterized protein n=1 Tax=Ficus carica TaxID=3494 RepID=A0AA88DBK3_FICCA|nr:hypothetical protein TIFTF001_021080 [Ficus carica]